jgi:hypothetical protein
LEKLKRDGDLTYLYRALALSSKSLPRTDPQGDLFISRVNLFIPQVNLFIPRWLPVHVKKARQTKIRAPGLFHQN